MTNKKHTLDANQARLMQRIIDCKTPVEALAITNAAANAMSLTDSLIEKRRAAELARVKAMNAELVGVIKNIYQYLNNGSYRNSKRFYDYSETMILINLLKVAIAAAERESK
jgi:hypothetical protein